MKENIINRIKKKVTIKKDKVMNRTININVIREKELINKNGKKFFIVEVLPEIVFIIDENGNFVTNYCGTINEDEDNLKIINLK